MLIFCGIRLEGASGGMHPTGGRPPPETAWDRRCEPRERCLRSCQLGLLSAGLGRVDVPGNRKVPSPPDRKRCARQGGATKAQHPQAVLRQKKILGNRTVSPDRPPLVDAKMCASGSAQHVPGQQSCRARQRLECITLASQKTSGTHAINWRGRRSLGEHGHRQEQQLVPGISDTSTAGLGAAIRQALKSQTF